MAKCLNYTFGKGVKELCTPVWVANLKMSEARKHLFLKSSGLQDKRVNILLFAFVSLENKSDKLREFEGRALKSVNYVLGHFVNYVIGLYNFAAFADRHERLIC